MIQNVSAIIIAAAAVIGLVPLGIRSIRDVVKSRQRKKTNDWAGTVALSVLLSLVAPSVLEAVGRHVKAAGDALPDWVKAAVPPDVDQQEETQPSDPGEASMSSPSSNGSEPQDAAQTGGAAGG